MTARIGPKKLKPRRIFLSDWREHRGLNQKQLADRLETSEATISRYENLKRDPTLGFIEAAAEALDTTPAALVGWPPEKTGSSEMDVASEALRQLSEYIKKRA